MKTNNAFYPHAHWLLRIVLASVFGYHGALKLADLGGFAQMLPISYLETVLVAWAEFGGGLLVLIGGIGRTSLFDAATRLGAALQIPTLIGAIALIHWGRWNFVPSEGYPMGGMEFQVSLILVSLYLVITGNNALANAPVLSSRAPSTDPTLRTAS